MRRYTFMDSESIIHFDCGPISSALSRDIVFPSKYDVVLSFVINTYYYKDGLCFQRVP